MFIKNVQKKPQKKNTKESNFFLFMILFLKKQVYLVDSQLSARLSITVGTQLAKIHE